MSLQTFSEYFDLGKSQHELDFVDVLVDNGDVNLFIDPYAISRRIDRWSIECHNLIVNFFQGVVDGIREGDDEKAHAMLAGLHEPNETRFGLSKGAAPSGRGIGDEQADRLYNALVESSAVRTGFLHNLEDAELLIPGIGRDKVSDVSTNIIRAKLIEYTQRECILFDVPMSNVPSGCIWDLDDEKWTSDYVQLPVCHDRSVLLVPKAIARYDLEFNHQEYYQHFVLNFLQTEHLAANSSLVRVLRDGTRKVPTKKSLKEKYPLSKPYLYDFTKEHPDVLVQYKRSKLHDFSEITDQAIEEANRKQRPVDYILLGTRLDEIPVGDDGASEFHNHIKGVLTAIFYPKLINPRKEREIHEGRKRIDIVYENAARSGFFLLLPQNKKVPSAYIMVECKNYSQDPANPALDQLAGRFSVNRGRFGLLVCRNFRNKDRFFARCRDTAQDDRGFIIPLDDEDLKLLLNLRSEGKLVEVNQFMDAAFRRLVM
jgi:hypothetical protein